MGISKEERERITRFAGTVDGQAARLMEFPEDHDTESRELASGAEALASDTRTLLEALDAADKHIAELQQTLENVSEVYLEITNGNILKPGTNPTVVLDYARESNAEDHAEDMRMKDQRIEELQQEANRLHTLYYGEREAHNSRGGA